MKFRKDDWGRRRHGPALREHSAVLKQAEGEADIGMLPQDPWGIDWYYDLDDCGWCDVPDCLICTCVEIRTPPLTRPVLG